MPVPPIKRTFTQMTLPWVRQKSPRLVRNRGNEYELFGRLFFPDGVDPFIKHDGEVVVEGSALPAAETVGFGIEVME